ncbi:OmpH family outer membrane protein [uncultured Alistipes sp.]|uniref:OmpH family outer membrane protein n=1 Tax=uncultured Alistipes sp. TaxID=538949 RepID=UPI00262809EF|nr:OmpH family outer membrane protein [uncultured Alistipes sp.]
MKTFAKLTLAAAFLFAGSAAVQAQKFGVINVSEVVMLMPEKDSADLKLQALQKELTDQLDAVQVEFNTKLQDFQKNSATYSEAVSQMKTKELNDLQTRYQELSQVAAQQYQKTQAELLTPLFEKAQKAIDKIGNDNGFTLIFNTESGPLAFQSSSVTDVFPLIKKELNLKDKPAADASAAN